MASPSSRKADEPGPLELRSLPVETVIKIYCELDIKAALRLAQTSKHMHDVYEKHSIYILGPILMRDFSPLDGLLRLIDVSRNDFEVPFSAWFNRRIYFAGWLISDDDERFASVPEIQFRQEHVPKVMEVVKAVSK